MSSDDSVLHVQNPELSFAPSDLRSETCFCFCFSQESLLLMPWCSAVGGFRPCSASWSDTSLPTRPPVSSSGPGAGLWYQVDPCEHGGSVFVFLQRRCALRCSSPPSATSPSSTWRPTCTSCGASPPAPCPCWAGSSSRPSTCLQVQFSDAELHCSPCNLLQLLPLVSSLYATTEVPRLSRVLRSGPPLQ